MHWLMMISIVAALYWQVGGYPRKAGEERKDVMAKNVSWRG
jgi:hypothetical protein